MALFQYRGIRIRPWMRKFHVIVPVVFSIILLIPAGLFVSYHLEALKVADVPTIVTAIALAGAGIV